jgi:hypothetical protein
MSYDAWKTRTDWDEEAKFYPGPYPGPSRDQIKQAIATRKKEIDWNINRLGNLVLSDEDRQQTEDYIMDLRDEVESLKRCFNV